MRRVRRDCTASHSRSIRGERGRGGDVAQGRCADVAGWPYTTLQAVAETRNLAARAGRWSAQHRKLAIWGWLGFVLVAFALGSAAGTIEQEQAESGVGESGRASSTLRKAFPKHVSEEIFI